MVERVCKNCGAEFVGASNAMLCSDACRKTALRNSNQRSRIKCERAARSEKQATLDADVLPGEEWRPVVGYGGIYSVSSVGRVKSSAHRKYYARILKQSTPRYAMVNLYRDGKMSTVSVHRLVAEAFTPNPLGHPCVDHIDRNKLNNTVSNLRWVSLETNALNSDRLERSRGVHIVRRAQPSGHVSMYIQAGWIRNGVKHTRNFDTVEAAEAYIRENRPGLKPIDPVVPAPHFTDAEFDELLLELLG